MRVRWYGQDEEEEFLGKYFEKDEKVTPDENLPLLVEGLDSAMLFHWAHKSTTGPARMLTQSNYLTENMNKLLQNDLRLRKMDIDIEEAVDKAKRARSGGARKKQKTR